ncbi:hypothetical protein QJ857_gp1149 [Tupanvirus soda lake]|uniref:Uncharacterized protein n=2 Tax=Tupanvirus TaxID=2094720 RepID=A0A6N1NJ92_9VIRU|nr:hypothetical protein QJ857_gp1149 [Tupanvirus soda lake]QKU34905.1 hypothetical protein [Tupanvirus soda lake]
MGNTTSYGEVPQENQDQTVTKTVTYLPNTTTQTVQSTAAPQSTVDVPPSVSDFGTNLPVQPVVTATPTPVAPKPVKPRTPYVHPFIEMINRNCSESEIINTLQAFCGRIEVGKDQFGRPIYEAVDQTEFIAPVLQVFSYCANNGKKTVVQWLLDNFVPLQVSYENNYCYFECLQWKHTDIADMLVGHESFVPSMEVLENLISRSKYAQFRKCMTSPLLPRGDLDTYRFTFMHYIDCNQFSNVSNLFRKIKQRSSGQQVAVDDKIYPNPRLAALKAATPLVPTPVVPEPVVPTAEPVVPTSEPVTPTEQPQEVPSTTPEPFVAGQESDTMQTDDVVLEVTEQPQVVSNDNMEVDAQTVSVPVTSIDIDQINTGLHQRTSHGSTSEN